MKTGIWIDLASAVNGNGMVDNTDYHPWIRVQIADGAELSIWLVRRFAPY